MALSTVPGGGPSRLRQPALGVRHSAQAEWLLRAAAEGRRQEPSDRGPHPALVRVSPTQPPVDRTGGQMGGWTLGCLHQAGRSPESAARGQGWNPRTGPGTESPRDSFPHVGSGLGYGAGPGGTPGGVVQKASEDTPRAWKVPSAGLAPAPRWSFPPSLRKRWFCCVHSKRKQRGRHPALCKDRLPRAVGGQGRAGHHRGGGPRDVDGEGGQPLHTLGPGRHPTSGTPSSFPLSTPSGHHKPHPAEETALVRPRASEDSTTGVITAGPLPWPQPRSLCRPGPQHHQPLMPVGGGPAPKVSFV